MMRTLVVKGLNSKIRLKVCKFSDVPLREKFPNAEILLVRIFATSYLSVFSPNAEKYGPEKPPYLDTFHALFLSEII